MSYHSYLAALEGLVSGSGEPERVESGFRFLEGPVWDQGAQRLLFSDIMGNALYTFRDDEGVKLFRPNSFLANGNTLDRDGNLITCEHGTSRVSRTTGINGFAAAGEYTVVATQFEGDQLNSPNDVVVRSDGGIYFTDPVAGRLEKVGIPREPELSISGVYRYDPSAESLQCIVRDFEFPNGLCFSPDEGLLFVNDSRRQHVRVFDVAVDGSVDNGRVFVELALDGPGVADGMKCDSQGYLYVSGPGGIQIYDSSGKLAGRLYTAEVAANFCWGGADLDWLYLTANTSLYRIRVGIPGLPVY